jgi:signal transduction histidine kinase
MRRLGAVIDGIFAALLRGARPLWIGAGGVAVCVIWSVLVFGRVADLSDRLSVLAADATASVALRASAESQAFAAAAERYARTGASADRAMLDRRLDVLFVRSESWSRSDRYDTPFRTEYLQTAAADPVLFDRFSRALDEMEALVAEPADAARLATASQRARGFGSAFFALETGFQDFRARRTAELRQALAQERATLGYAFAMLAFAGGVFVLTALRRVRDLRRSERRFMAALDGASDGLFDWCVASDRVYFTPQNWLNLGLDPDTVGGSLEEWRRRVHPDDCDRVFAAIDAHLNMGVRYDVTYRMGHADGGWRWWRSRGEATRDGSDGGLRMVGVNTDVTPLIEARDRAVASAAEAAAATERLEAERGVARLQRQFVSMVSHEFRTPLAIIDGRARQVERRAARDLPPEPAGYFAERGADIRRAVARLVELIESVLAASRLEEGAIDYRPRPCALNALVTELVDLSAEMNPMRDVRADLDPACDAAVCDPVLIRQIVSNLLSNAAKYSDDGAVLTAATRRDPVTGEVCIAVSDTGIGIPKDELDRLFTRFFRASTAAGRPGSGIGLHLVAHFVALHGGRVEARSAVGVGSTFTAIIPGDIAPAAAAEAAA